jgi:glucosamine--fructose-6-phosphate aminotransferase (isomerizing)
VLAIVNRRRSDLTDRVDGVLYTSDGRDVEMSVASTKAFYAQVAAGVLLASAIADLVNGSGPSPMPAAERSAMLAALRELPAAMEATLARRPVIAAAASQFAPPKRNWAVVGSGADRIAAEELRIKLSELCYKAIPCDTTEDKKHIDLSSEPLVVVCATGLAGSNADDVAKEVAIYRAHKAVPVVIASEGEERFSAAFAVITVPSTHPRLAFVLATLAGHLFGYEAALAIDAQAIPLREARGVVEDLVVRGLEGDELLAALEPAFAPVAARFHDGLRSGAYDGQLDAGVAVHVASLLRYAAGVTPLDSYQVEHGRQGSPSVLVDDLTAGLTAAIDQLTRPVDAIKHQAKTVTVGISRSDEGVLQVPLVAETLAAGAPRDRLTYRAMRTLAALDPAVAEVTGFTRYRIDGDVAEGNATIGVVDRGGISLDLPLRTEANPTLRGQKHRAASEREVTVAVGRSDGRRIVLVPEVKGHQCTGMTLLHVRFHERLDSRRMRSVLEGYRNRYGALRDQVTETEPVFRDDLLGDQPVVDLLTVPVAILAARWRSG